MAQAAVRFEGRSTNGSNDPDPTVPSVQIQYDLGAQRQMVTIALPWEDDKNATYSYDANVVSASYSAGALPDNWRDNIFAQQLLVAMDDPELIRLEYASDGVDAPLADDAVLAPLFTTQVVNGYSRVSGIIGDWRVTEFSTTVLKALKP